MQYYLLTKTTYEDDNIDEDDMDSNKINMGGGVIKILPAPPKNMFIRYKARNKKLTLTAGNINI